MKNYNKTRGNRLAKNLYNMLCYNMSALNNLRITEANIDGQSGLTGLIVQMMYMAIEELKDNNYFEQYHFCEKALSKPIGDIDIIKSINSGCYAEGKLFCHYDELSIDNATNQLIKSAIGILYDILLDKNNSRLNWIISYMDEVYDDLYTVSDLNITEGIDERYIDECVQSQPEYCAPAIYLSYFIINSFGPNEGEGTKFIDCQDPASYIIETFIRKYLSQEYSKARSLLDGELVLSVGELESGIRPRELIMDAALMDKIKRKVLIIDSKDYRKQSDSNGIHQLIDYYHEFKAKYDTYDVEYDIDLVLIFSDVEHTAQDYDKQFHPFSDNRLQTIRIRYIDFDHWDFKKICDKLISIVDETFVAEI